MSLFGSATLGADNRRLLLTLRAGRMYKKDEDGKIHPDTRSGILTLTMESSGVIEMKWEAMAGSSKAEADSAAQGPPTESTIIMPGGAKFERVTKVTTGRVFVIDFGGARQLFYWLQEQPDAERDANYFRALKNAIEGTTRQGGAASSRSGAGGAAAGGASSTSRDAAPSSSSSTDNSGIQLAALQNILAGLGGSSQSTTATGNATGASSSAAAAQQQQQRTPNVHLQDVIRSDPSKNAMRADPAFYMSRIFSHLPEGTDPSSDVMVDHVLRPQFYAAGDVLDSALQDPNGYREIMSAFGLQAPAQVPPSSWGLLQAILAEKPSEKKSGDDEKKVSDDAAPAANGNNSDDKQPPAASS